MRTTLIFIGIFLLLGIPLWAQKTENERLENCATVLGEILDMPDSVPQELLDKAECVLVFPSVKKAAFGLGGRYGRGAQADPSPGCPARRSGRVAISLPRVSDGGPWGRPLTRGSANPAFASVSRPAGTET